MMTAKCPICAMDVELNPDSGALIDHKTLTGGGCPASGKAPRRGRMVTVARHARRSINTTAELARAHGFTVKEISCLDIDGTVSLDVEGHGDVLALNFREDPTTKYLRWDYAHTYGGDVYRTWKEIRARITRHPLISTTS